MSTNDRVRRDEMSGQLLDAGERLELAQTEPERHAAAADLLRLRLIYFTGRKSGPYRDPEEFGALCDKLTAREVRAITDWCWASYSGGMEAMKQGMPADRGPAS